jgi:type I restriction enzyme R subunit
LAEALEAFVVEVPAGRQQDDTGLDPETQLPFLGLLKQTLAPKRKLELEELDQLCPLTVEIVEHIRSELQDTDFWRKTQAQERLLSWVFNTLDDANVFQFDVLPQVSERIMELAKTRHATLAP